MTEPISRIEAALAGLGAEHEPPVGWEARVLAATATRPRTRWWWWLSVPVGAIAGLLLWLVPARSQPLGLDVAFKGGPLVRGSADHQQGQVLVATATGGGAHREIRIYREDILVLVCPGGPTCRGSERAELKFDRTGRYQVFVLTSGSPIPPPGAPSDASHPSTLDHDLAVADGAGVFITRSAELVVR